MVTKIILWLLLAYVIGVLFYAFSRHKEMIVSLYLKPLHQPYFKIGVSYTSNVYADGRIETLSIGLFFFGIDLDFIMHGEGEDDITA